LACLPLVLLLRFFLLFPSLCLLTPGFATFFLPSTLPVPVPDRFFAYDSLSPRSCIHAKRVFLFDHGAVFPRLLQSSSLFSLRPSPASGTLIKDLFFSSVFSPLLVSPSVTVIPRSLAVFCDATQTFPPPVSVLLERSRARLRCGTGPPFPSASPFAMRACFFK